MCRMGRKKKTGYYQKYKIEHADGTPIDSNAVYFVLRLDKDPFALTASYAYALACVKEQPQLASDLMFLIRECFEGMEEKEISGSMG